jgi:hypothetical protein
VLTAIEEFFDALAKRDRDALLATVVAEGSITAHGMRDGRARARTQSWQEWAEGIAKGKERLDEQVHDPDVRVRGSLASVWSQYSFHVDGRFSHCGIDNFDLAKVDGRWRIVSLSFTVETENCRRR